MRLRKCVMTNKILISEPITPELISSKLAVSRDDRNTGAQAIFIGRIRADIKETKRVKAIEYTAYEPMVISEAEKIRQILLSEFEDISIIDIVHSTGIVPAGEISSLVIVSGCHRQQALEACSRTIDLIKERLPIWKKEIFDDNTQEWKQDHLP